MRAPFFDEPLAVVAFPPPMRRVLVVVALLTTCAYPVQSVAADVELNPSAKAICRAYEDALDAVDRAREDFERVKDKNEYRYRRVRILDKSGALAHSQETKELLDTVDQTNREALRKMEDATKSETRTLEDLQDARKRATKPTDIEELRACTHAAAVRNCIGDDSPVCATIRNTPAYMKTPTPP
jgi:hypothetical protein